MLKKFSLSACVLLISVSYASAAAPLWKRYAEPESELRVDVPTGVFPQDAGVPEGGKGRRFVASDGASNLTVQTIPNERRLTPAAFLASKSPPAGIIYKRVTADFFVVSSFRKDVIFYNRCNFLKLDAHCVFINYPSSQKKRFDATVTRISRSLIRGAERTRTARRGYIHQTF